MITIKNQSYQKYRLDDIAVEYRLALDFYQAIVLVEHHHPLLIRGVLKSTWFIILHTNKIHRYRLKSFGHPANEHKFIIQLYNLTAKNQSDFLPMELITVNEWQRSLKPLTTEHRVKRD
ncbi:unnamed protein product [Rotaria sp. Silwood2]|nr:unnamed protein product [Rotaria sp. Silwood2]